MSSAVATREVVMKWRGPIAVFMRDTTPEISLEGGLSSGKTTACLWKEFNAYQEMPGIHGWIGRYGDGETQTKIRPAFEAICQEAGCIPVWNAKELSYDFPNTSKAYVYGLKSPDALSRYSKMRGMGVSRIYNDQTEELPEDFSLELRLRLRQAGFPHQLVFSPNPPNVTHWLAQQFPTDNRIPGRKYYSISIHDNAHNLPVALMTAALLAYPPEHAKHRSVILGLRGMNVTGEPVYKGAFVRALHEAPVAYQPGIPLEVALDFGKHHPCILVRQVSPLGQRRYLGGILGQQLYLDDFLTIALKKLAEWFPEPIEVKWCCDPAGMKDTSHGTAGARPILMDHLARLPRFREDSNSPAVRLGMVERLAKAMRQRSADRLEAFVINSDSERWLTISENATVPDRFYADGCEAGYVWDEHMVSVGSKQVRKPKKDGWYEHAQNCLSGDVRVVTSGGLIPIRDLCGVERVEVRSRSGAWVMAFGARRTRRNAPMVRVSFGDGSMITCTPDHQFLTPKGWMTAGRMRGRACYNGVCQARQNARVSSSLRAKSIGVLARITSEWGSGCIALCGSPLMVLSLSDTTFTIGITTRMTTVQRTWNASYDSITSVITASSRRANALRGMLLNPVAHGIARLKGWRGIGTTTRREQKDYGAVENHGTARVAGRCFRPLDPLRQSRVYSVLQTVARKTVRRVVWTIGNASAWGVAASSQWIATRRHEPVARNVSLNCLVECVGVEPMPNEDAYCLDVPAVHAFCVEGGMVTHNCSEYLEANFGSTPRVIPVETAVESRGPKLQWQ